MQMSYFDLLQCEGITSVIKSRSKFRRSVKDVRRNLVVQIISFQTSNNLSISLALAHKWQSLIAVDTNYNRELPNVLCVVLLSRLFQNRYRN